MPVHQGSDSRGPYYQWGNSGKKYYYTKGDPSSSEDAKQKANRQARAIYASGYKGK